MGKSKPKSKQIIHHNEDDTSASADAMLLNSVVVQASDSESGVHGKASQNPNSVDNITNGSSNQNQTEDRSVSVSEHSTPRFTNSIRIVPSQKMNGHSYSSTAAGQPPASLLPRSTPMLPMPMTNGHVNSNSNGITSANGVALNQMRRGPDYQRLSVPGAGFRHRPTPLTVARMRAHGDKRLLSDSYKVIAFICGLFACLLLVMALASSEWLIEPGGYRQGLFVYCLPKLMPNVTVPFVDPGNADLTSEGCHRIDLSRQAYTLVAAAFVVVSLLVNVFATLLTVLGLRCRDPNNKYKYYRIAVYVMAVALVAVLVALVVYPVCFANIMEKSGRQYWEFGWAYGVAWGAAIFLFGGVILLLCDKESEEIYYKERTIVQYADTNNKA